MVAAWVALGLALGLWAPAADPRANQPASFLPEDVPYSRAVAAMRESFPSNSGLSEAVIVFERADGELTPADLAAIEVAAGRVAMPSPVADAGDLAGVRVRSPGSFLVNPNPLVSSASNTGQAGLVVVNIPANFITLESDRVVNHIRHVLGPAELPAGLKVSVTGSSGFGHDYADAAETSHARTLRVTVAAVVIILLLVYRSPVAAAIPLAAISLAAFVAMKVLACAQHVGMHVGTAERIFVIVLIYGAGTDYSLFLMSRFRELLNQGLASAEAAGAALSATFPAILASAGTNIAGLLMLRFAGYGPFRTTGPAVAVALAVALLAAVTLVPSLVAIAGRRLSWPAWLGRAGPGGGTLGIGEGRLWPAVARAVTARPATVFLAVLALLAVPAAQGVTLHWVYDTLAAIEPKVVSGVGNAAAGVQAVRRHWPVGEISPVQVLVRTDRPRDEQQWRQTAAALTDRLSAEPGVKVVRSLTRPLGRDEADLGQAVLGKLAAGKIRDEYLSFDMRATRLAVVLDSPAYSLAAMETTGKLRRVAEAQTERIARSEKAPTSLCVAGATAEMMAIRAVTHDDFRRVSVLTLTVIFLIVLLLLRDAVLSAFMVASTVLSYFAALGLSYLFFAGLLGQEGLDWKVEVFLFVVMVAVGVDYNIFLASRLAQEARTLATKPAIQAAVAHTGPVISACGLIMAATLGSLMAGDLQLLRQLGFALALGMLIDTFVVRPLLLPAFVGLSGRTGRPAGLARRQVQ